MISLSEAFPELAAQWDYERNGDITPDTVSYGSNLKVWWKCPICGHSYQKKIGNRTAPAKRKTESAKCPICLGRVIIPGYNSLKARYPEIVEKEWDFEKNTIDPDTISPYYRKKVWWKCPNGHSYESLSGNKILNNGGNCPYCSSQKLCRETSLGVVNPELAKEWHPNKNGVTTPFDVFANSNKSYWWLCPICGHEWKAKCSNRNMNKRGCPHCANSRSSSVPEQLMFRAIQSICPDAINRHRINNDEIDVYIPSEHIGFEYDGQRFHNLEKLPKDIAKSKRLIKNGVELYRFREEDCPILDVEHCHIIQVKHSSEYKDLELKLKDLLIKLFPQHHNINFKFEDVINEVIATLDCVPYEQSFAASEAKKQKKGIEPVALWDYETNAPLTPQMVTPKSNKIVNWICPTNPNHKWKAKISSVSNGFGCKECSGWGYVYTTEEWIEEAKKVHGDKYQYHLVKYINSETKIKIVCPKHGVFSQIPYSHLQGQGCPYCAHQKFHASESLATLYPEIAAQWDYEMNKNTGYTPDNIGIDTRKKFYWHCNNGCNHSYLATIAYRVTNNSGCAICHGKQVSPDTSLAAVNPSLAAEWCPENDKTPYEVTAKSDYVAIWKCPNPNHPPYRQKVEVRSRGVGCVYCHKGKKHPKDYEDELHIKFPNIKILKPFSKSSERIECKCEVCGHVWQPYPYTLLRSRGCPKCKK